VSDFVTGLRRELVEAAEREQGRRLPRLHRPSPQIALALVATAAMALIIVLAAGALTPRETDNERPAEPRREAERDLFGGTLVADVRYRTRAFVPALSFVVPDDLWYAGDTAQPAKLVLDRRVKTEIGEFRRPPGWLAFDRINQVVEPTARRSASVIPAPTELYEWLHAHPDLRVGEASPATVAGVPAKSFPVEVRFSRPAHSDIRCRREHMLTCTLVTPDMSFTDGTRMRMLIVATEPQPLVVTIGGHSARELATVERAAAPVLESLRIGVP
jgi:hypothetical protein